jgi:hypothetical protein
VVENYEDIMKEGREVYRSKANEGRGPEIAIYKFEFDE